MQRSLAWTQRASLGDFGDDELKNQEIIIVISGPGVNDHYLEELAGRLERHLPTRTRKWHQIVEWRSAIANLRKEDLKVARGHLSTTGGNHRVRFNDNDEFQLHFSTEYLPASRNEAKIAADELQRRVDESTITKRIRLSFSDHHGMTEDMLFAVGHTLRCHCDLLKAAVTSNLRDPIVSTQTPS